MNKTTPIINKNPFVEISTDDRIVKDYNRIKTLVHHCRGLGFNIVLTQGTFDMLHVGHGRYLKEAKKYGDLLIVGVDSDKKVKKRKGPERPVVPQEERLEMLTHLRHVDLVFLKELDDPKWGLIKTICPDVLIATKATYTPKQIKELKQYCGKVVVLSYFGTTSTSAKLRLLQLNTAKKLGQSLTPKLLKAMEEVLNEVKS